MAWRVGCGAVALFAGWGPLRDPSGTLPGSPAVYGPRGTLSAPRSAVLSATYEEICVSGARGSAFFRPSVALGLRPGPCCSLARGLRSSSWSVGVPGHVLAGLVWLCVRFSVGCWVCSVCAWFMASQGSPGRRPVAGGCTVAALGRWGCMAGAFGCWGRSARGRKNAEHLSRSGRRVRSRCAFLRPLAVCGTSGEEPPHRTRARLGASAPH